MLLLPIQPQRMRTLKKERTKDTLLFFLEFLFHLFSVCFSSVKMWNFVRCIHSWFATVWLLSVCTCMSVQRYPQAFFSRFRFDFFKKIYLILEKTKTQQ